MEAYSVHNKIIIEYPDVSRFEKINEHTVIVASGEYADFQ